MMSGKLTRNPGNSLKEFLMIDFDEEGAVRLNNNNTAGFNYSITAKTLSGNELPQPRFQGLSCSRSLGSSFCDINH